jgi:hypothetical protein
MCQGDGVGIETMSGNPEKYHFADFTRENYRRLLQIARKTWTFRRYTDFSKTERFLILRHDIDISPHAAVKMAQIERDEGAVATYYVNLHSEFYNLLEREISDCVLKIAALGHDIGLHFDSHYHGVTSEDQLDALLVKESALLQQTLGVRVASFSFHNTTDFTMNCRKPAYGSLINAYASYFQNDVGYCSDSNGHWRFRRLEDVLRDAKDERLIVLTHPEHWPENAMAPRRRVLRAVEGRAARVMERYDGFLKAAGRENIDG